MFRRIATTPVVPEFAGIFRRLCGMRANSGSGGKFPNYAANVLPPEPRVTTNPPDKSVLTIFVTTITMHVPSESGGQIR
jgi:hypothetical protein